MLFVYNADRKNSGKNGKEDSFIFKHFGSSPAAAAERIEGMFTHQENCSINDNLSVNILDLAHRVIGTKSLEQYLMDFCEHTRKFHISEYWLDVKRPLRLNDLWEDDPIGSGGPDIVDEKQLTVTEKDEIRRLFYPFDRVIHLPHIFNVMSNRDIKGIKRHYDTNPLFKAELKKRKRRSESIGEDFSKAQFQEIVWLDMTFKLKNWALEKGYDSFVYSNHKEGNGEDSFVTLLPNQIKATGKSFEFIEQKYLTEIPSEMYSMMERLRYQRTQHHCHTLWAQKDPMRFWAEMP